MVRKSACETHERQRRALVVVATYNVRTVDVKARNGHGRDECVPARIQHLGCDFVALQETRRKGETTFEAAGDRVFCCGQQEKSQASQGLHGVGLAVKESICRKSTYSKQFVDERLMAMRFLVV